MQQQVSEPRLEIAFAKSETELRVVFSEPVDPDSAAAASNYKTRSGLTVLGAQLDRDDPRSVRLETEPMNGEDMIVDVLVAADVRTRNDRPVVRAESPEFILGIASIPEIQKPGIEEFPFASRFVGKVASASCGKDGGVDSNTLIDTFGFAFIHMESGGPFNSLKIATQRHLPGIVEATRRLDPGQGQTVHVLWAGGEIRNVEGENQLVDSGFMEGSIIAPNPIQSPPPFPIKTAEIAGEEGRTLRAKGLQGVIVSFKNVTVDEVAEPDYKGLRSVRFHDDSDGQAVAMLLGNVTVPLEVGQTIGSLRGLVHQPRPGHCEAIIELNEHLVMDASKYPAI